MKLFKLKNPDTIDRFSIGHFIINLIAGFIILIPIRSIQYIGCCIHVYFVSIHEFLEYILAQLFMKLHIWKYISKLNLLDPNGYSFYDIIFNISGFMAGLFCASFIFSTYINNSIRVIVAFIFIIYFIQLFVWRIIIYNKEHK